MVVAPSATARTLITRTVTADCEPETHETGPMPRHDSAQPDIPHATAFFMLTMTSVFGAGLFWSTFGDVILDRWNTDVAEMKATWEQTTTPDRKFQRQMFGVDWRSIAAGRAGASDVIHKEPLAGEIRETGYIHDEIRSQDDWPAGRAVSHDPDR